MKSGSWYKLVIQREKLTEKPEYNITVSYELDKFKAREKRTQQKELKSTNKWMYAEQCAICEEGWWCVHDRQTAMAAEFTIPFLHSAMTVMENSIFDGGG